MLTEEQKLQLEKFRDKCVNIGLSTEAYEPERAIAEVAAFYEYMGMKMPSKIVKCEGILEAQYKINEHYNAGKPKAYVGTDTWGSCDIYWLSTYLFARDYVGVTYPEKENKLLDAWYRLAKSCFWVWMFEDMVVISNRPKNIVFNSDMQLHNSEGPALAFRDDWRLYFLNGIRIPDEFYKQPWDELDPELVLTNTENVEQRREILQMIQPEHWVSKLDHKVIDRKGTDKLLEVTISGFPDGLKYLWMENPSTDEVHCEGVDRRCATVQEAHNWRAYRDRTKLWVPSQLT